jgi:phosphopantetheine adenylyltransferase
VVREVALLGGDIRKFVPEAVYSYFMKDKNER